MLWVRSIQRKEISDTLPEQKQQQVTNLISEKQGRSITIQDRSGKLADGQAIIKNYTIMGLVATMQSWAAINILSAIATLVWLFFIIGNKSNVRAIVKF